jgi:acetyl-CoA carboxylase alpha subunit
VIRESADFSRFNMEGSLEDIRRLFRMYLKRLTKISPNRLVEKRHEKFLGMRGL